MDRKDEVLLKFGRQVASLRKKNEISISSLAAAAGLKEDQLRRIEAGEVNVLFTTIIAIAGALNTSPGELLANQTG